MEKVFRQFETVRRAEPWLGEVRALAFARFTVVGVPTTRNEEWKYTNVTSVARTAWQLAPEALVDESTLKGACLVEEGPRIVLVNGIHAPSLSRGAQGTVIITSIAAAMRTHADVIKAHLGTIASSEASSFVALNTAFLFDGALIIIPPQTHVAQPLQVIHVSVPGADRSMIHPRTLIIAGDGSEATIIESHVAIGDGAYFSNAVSEIAVGKNATLTHCCVEEPAKNAVLITSPLVTVAENGTYRSCVITDGGAITRNTHRVVLAGADSRCEMDGLYFVRGSQHVDNHTEIDHAAPRTSSRELYKGVLNDSSRAVFNGKVFVRPAAQKTDAKQTNRNLMLSAKAQVDTKPQLEIWADDVKCTHGATVGQIDPASLFYLKTRGIGEAAGRRLLTYGFAHEILEQIPHEPLRARLEARLLAAVEHPEDSTHTG
jgi:Fe-S cluster assembly protein SufD